MGPGGLQRARPSSSSWERTWGPFRRSGLVQSLTLYNLEYDPVLLFGLSFPSVTCSHSSLPAPPPFLAISLLARPPTSHLSVPSGCLANAGGVSVDSRSDHDVPLSHSVWVASPRPGRVVSLWVHETLLLRGGKTTSNLLFIF